MNVGGVHLVGRDEWTGGTTCALSVSNELNALTHSYPSEQAIVRVLEITATGSPGRGEERPQILPLPALAGIVESSKVDLKNSRPCLG